MNREIKFRGWDTANKTMTMNIQDDYIVGEWANDSRFVLMQFTGLTDRNEKEMFDREIIEHMDPVTLKTIVSEIYWSDKGYWALRDKNGKFVDLLHRAESPEVIGNVFEHPHLLKE